MKFSYVGQHPDKVLELYCRGCNCLVCFACAFKSHSSHDTQTIQDSIEASLPEIFESNEKVDERVQDPSGTNKRGDEND